MFFTVMHNTFFIFVRAFILLSIFDISAIVDKEIQ